MKFVRKIMFRDERYAAIEIPKVIVDDLKERNATHMELTFDEKRGILTAVAV